MITISALFLKIDGILDYYSPRQLQADLAFPAFVSNSRLFDGKHQKDHLIFEKKKGKSHSRSSVLVTEFRQRRFSRQRLGQYET